MAKFDADAVTALKSDVDFSTRPLEVIISSGQDQSIDPFEAHLFYFLERYAVNDDYTIDLPVYLVTRGKNYLGHTKGELTREELRSQLREILDSAENSQS